MFFHLRGMGVIAASIIRCPALAPPRQVHAVTITTVRELSLGVHQSTSCTEDTTAYQGASDGVHQSTSCTEDTTAYQGASDGVTVNA